jgi:CP family cyanate transporter-like MFS transporter
VNKQRHWLALVTVLAIAFVLRPAVAQIGPILSQIQDGLAVSNTEMAILTAVPVLCFGFGAFASPALVRRFGINHSMVYLLLILLVAVAVRPYVGFYGLLIGSTIAGLAIAVANVLLPSIVRERFASKVVVMTTAYTTVLAASASFAAAVSFPSAALGGWQFSLAIWALPTLLAVALSFSLLKGHESAAEPSHEDHSAQWKAVWASPITWWVTALFGLQSLGFYALLAWLPTVAIATGVDPAGAGGLLSLMTIIGVPVRFFLTPMLHKWFNQSVEGVLISLLTAVGMVLMIFGLWIPAVILVGIGQASSFPLSLSLIATRAKSMELTTILSSVVQGVGYLIAAAGTFLFGWLGSATGNWHVSIYLIIGVTLVQVVSGWYSGKERVIG